MECILMTIYEFLLRGNNYNQFAAILFSSQYVIIYGRGYSDLFLGLYEKSKPISV